MTQHDGFTAKILFAVFSTSSSPQKLLNMRRTLKNHLVSVTGQEIDLVNLKITSGGDTYVSRIVEQGEGMPVVVLDEDHPHPRKASWYVSLKAVAGDLKQAQRPRLIYITGQADARGALEAADEALIHEYIGLRGNAQWHRAVTSAVVRLLTPMPSRDPATTDDPDAAEPGIVGRSRCMQECVTTLMRVLRAPCGLVTGKAGTGKMHLIRDLWPQIRSELGFAKSTKAKISILPCGSVFKEFYFDSRRPVSVSTRDILLEPYFKWYLDEADQGLLVLHHIDLLPWSVQHELADVLEKAAHDSDGPTQLKFINEEGFFRINARIVGTSELSPDELQQTKRMVPDLLRRLGKFHVAIPELGHRSEDIGLLAADIVKQIAKRMSLEAVPVLEDGAVKLLEETRWPGNISDLVRVLERAVGKYPKVQVLTKAILRDASEEFFEWAKRPTTWDEQIAAAERDIIRRATIGAGRTVEQAAKELLHKNTQWLFRKVKELGLGRELGIKTRTPRKEKQPGNKRKRRPSPRS